MNVGSTKQVDVKDILRRAAEEVEASGVSEEFREAAFSKAVDLIARPAIGSSDTGMQSGSISLPQGGVGVPARTETILRKIASRLKLADDVVREVFHEEDGTIDIVVSPTRFHVQKSKATKELALLVAAGRQAAALEEFTSVAAIRPVVENFKRYDPPNFSTTISEMTTEFNHRGTGRKKEVRVSKPGWEAATALVTRLGGAES
jgi:hypothetical protein